MWCLWDTNINEVNVEIKGIDTLVTAHTKNTKSGIEKQMWDEVEFHAEALSMVKRNCKVKTTYKDVINS